MQGNSLTVEFLQLYNKLNTYDKFIASIGWHIAPVVFSHKPAALVNLGKAGDIYRYMGLTGMEKQYDPLDIIVREAEVHNIKKLFAGELNAVLFSDESSSCRLFCYMPERINAICMDHDVRCFLMNMGYKSFDPEDCINTLKQRFQRGKCPHEIGIFLGYPLDDVTAFILHEGRNYLINGYWKVYTNAFCALNTFLEYDNARKQMLHILDE